MIEKGLYNLKFRDTTSGEILTVMISVDTPDEYRVILEGALEFAVSNDPAKDDVVRQNKMEIFSLTKVA